MTDPLSMWTVYKHPKDFPQAYVARRFEVDGEGARPTADILLSPDLERLRETLAREMHLVCLMRNEGDDPVIVETWL